MDLLEAILVAASLCADCLAVSLCSGVRADRLRMGQVLGTALVFAGIHVGFLQAGWLFGALLAGFVERISRFIALGLLLYVGGMMLAEGVRGRTERQLLDSWPHILMAAIATSIDALTVGVARSMSGDAWKDFLPLLLSLFVLTVPAVATGLLGGHRIGTHFGRQAEIAGGFVLIVIGLSVLF